MRHIFEHTITSKLHVTSSLACLIAYISVTPIMTSLACNHWRKYQWVAQRIFPGSVKWFGQDISIIIIWPYMFQCKDIRSNRPPNMMIINLIVLILQGVWLQGKLQNHNNIVPRHNGWHINNDSYNIHIVHCFHNHICVEAIINQLISMGRGIHSFLPLVLPLNWIVTHMNKCPSHWAACNQVCCIVRIKVGCDLHWLHPGISRVTRQLLLIIWLYICPFMIHILHISHIYFIDVKYHNFLLVVVQVYDDP